MSDLPYGVYVITDGIHMSILIGYIKWSYHGYWFGFLTNKNYGGILISDYSYVLHNDLTAMGSKSHLVTLDYTPHEINCINSNIMKMYFDSVVDRGHRFNIANYDFFANNCITFVKVILGKLGCTLTTSFDGRMHLLSFPKLRTDYCRELLESDCGLGFSHTYEFAIIKKAGYDDETMHRYVDTIIRDKMSGYTVRPDRVSFRSVDHKRVLSEFFAFTDFTFSMTSPSPVSVSMIIAYCRFFSYILKDKVGCTYIGIEMRERVSRNIRESVHIDPIHVPMQLFDE